MTNLPRYSFPYSLCILVTAMMFGCGGSSGPGASGAASVATTSNYSTSGTAVVQAAPTASQTSTQTPTQTSVPAPTAVDLSTAQLPSSSSPTPPIPAPSSPKVALTATSPGTTAVMTDSVFAPSSFWYTPLPLNAPLDVNSKNYVAEFLRQKQAYYGNVNINTNSYTSPVYIAPSNAPTVKVTYWNCQHKTYIDKNLAAQWAAVPIPANAVPSAGADGEMTIYQPSTQTLWEFWQARKVNGEWEACWGGEMKNTKSSEGIWSAWYGTTATGLPFLGGQITAEELQRGEIRHAIGIALVDVEKYSIFSYPAMRSDGYNPLNAPNRIPEGTRFRLDPTINVDALKMHPVAKIIAKAAQKYGFVVWDKSGAIALRAENSLSYTSIGLVNPYTALYNGTPSYALLNGFPWDKLQFLPKNYPNNY
ncbi:hypothetical protein AAKU67_004420 [Oxalobacteraceae bacterium GrIS 2.11]